jgi:hypothetical protein
MKRLLFAWSALMLFVFPSMAQSHDYNLNDLEPSVLVKITKDQVPPAVVSAVNVQFDKNNPETWSRFPYALKEYGWVYDIGAKNVDLDRYEVTMKTREMATNIPIPASVMEEFLKSKYKDWKMTGNKEIIRFYHDHATNTNNVEQHFRITVEKDGVKKSISFNWQGTN